MNLMHALDAIFALPEDQLVKEVHVACERYGHQPSQIERQLTEMESPLYAYVPHQVLANRNMVVMMRDRVQDMIRRGMTLVQIKAAKPTLDFDGRYGSNTGSWTTDMFVEAVYKSLSQKK